MKRVLLVLVAVLLVCFSACGYDRDAYHTQVAEYRDELLIARDMLQAMLEFESGYFLASGTDEDGRIVVSETLGQAAIDFILEDEGYDHPAARARITEKYTALQEIPASGEDERIDTLVWVAQQAYEAAADRAEAPSGVRNIWQMGFWEDLGELDAALDELSGYVATDKSQG